MEHISNHKNILYNFLDEEGNFDFYPRGTIYFVMSAFPRVRLCAEKVKKLLPTLETKDITPGKIGWLRNQVRERLADELRRLMGS